MKKVLVWACVIGAILFLILAGIWLEILIFIIAKSFTLIGFGVLLTLVTLFFIWAALPKRKKKK